MFNIICLVLLISLILYMIYEIISLTIWRNKWDEKTYEWQRKIGQSQIRINEMQRQMNQAQLQGSMGNRVWLVAEKDGRKTIIGGWKNEWYKEAQWRTIDSQERETMWFKQGYFIKSQIEPYIGEYELSFQ